MQVQEFSRQKSEAYHWQVINQQIRRWAAHLKPQIADLGSSSLRKKATLASEKKAFIFTLAELFFVVEGVKILPYVYTMFLLLTCCREGIIFTPSLIK